MIEMAVALDGRNGIAVLGGDASRNFRHFFDTPPESATEAGENAL